MVDITLLTEDRYVDPIPKDPYILNILQEDSLVQHALERLGLKCNRVSWSDPSYDWSKSRYLLFRTTWDYFERLDEFQKWLNNVDAQTQLINPGPLIFWNLNKQYLLDLQTRGVNVVESSFVTRPKQRTLQEVAKEHGWKDLIIKPVVSGAAMDTHLIKSTQVAAYEGLFQELLEKQPMIVQEAQDFVMAEGEFSLIVIGGKYSHAVKKVAKEGDFRVQDDFGGTVHDYEAAPDEIAFAERAAANCEPPPLYARVDMIYDNQGRLAVMELELIEPELWFRNKPEAADLLATEIKNFLK